MILPEFEYLKPESLDEAISLASQMGNSAKLMAGGTDVMVAMSGKAIAPEYIIDLKGIPGLSDITYEKEKGLKIGSLVKLKTIQTSETVASQYQAVCEAAHFVASNQIRCLGTMAGNICNASPSCDTAPILIVLDAEVHTERPEGSSRFPVETLFTGPKHTRLVPGEIVTEITIPDRRPGQGAAYLKLSYRKAMDLAIVGVAASIVAENGICKEARIALGAVAATPVRAAEAEKILTGSRLTQKDIEDASIAAMNGCHPISDVRASADYRRDMVRVFTKRAIAKAIEDIRQEVRS